MGPLHHDTPRVAPVFPSPRRPDSKQLQCIEAMQRENDIGGFIPLFNLTVLLTFFSYISTWLICKTTTSS